MFFQYYICNFPLFSTKYMIKSYISLAPVCWHVTTWEIWGNPITDHKLVTLYTSQWKWWSWGYENVTNLLCMLRVIWLAKKHIYHISICSWHNVTHMRPIMGFSQISQVVCDISVKRSLWEIWFLSDCLKTKFFFMLTKKFLPAGGLDIKVGGVWIPQHLIYCWCIS